MKRRLFISMALAIGLSMATGVSGAQAASPYEGKTLRLIVGTSPGGGYDTYARAIARHMSKHIPGKPTIVVQNMPGAGSMIAANYLYNVAKPNGMTMAMLISGLVMEQGMGTEGVKFDARKLDWIGAPTVGMPVCAVMGFTGIKTFDDIIKSKKPIRFGAAGSSTREQARIIKRFLGGNVEPVYGYRGTAPIRAAMQRREVDGACWQWVSMKITARGMLDATGDDKLIPLLIQGKADDPEVKDLPQYTDLIKGEKDQIAFKAWLGQYLFFRPFALPPNTPKENLAILRKAFRETLKDPEFLKLANKTKMDLNYVAPDQIYSYVDQTLSTPPDVKQTLKEIIGN